MAYEVDHHGNLSSREGEVNRLLNGYVINSSLTLSPQKNCNDKKKGGLKKRFQNEIEEKTSEKEKGERESERKKNLICYLFN